MLQSLLIWSMVIVPLGIAIVLIAYRARFFILAIAGIALIVGLIWAALRLGVVADKDDPALTPSQPIVKTISCEYVETDSKLGGCGS